LLTPGRDPIGVFGEAWGALRYKEYAVLKGYRLRIDEGYVNSQDNRIVPNTFEAVTLSGAINWGAVRRRVSHEHQASGLERLHLHVSAGWSVGRQRRTRPHDTDLDADQGPQIYTGNYYAVDVFNTAFGSAGYTGPARGRASDAEEVVSAESNRRSL